jgi:starch-binding outer membrane protein, SusD/RagB family
MIDIRKRLLGAALVLSVFATTGCDDFLDVHNPNNLESEAVDEERDRTMLSWSAYQAFSSRHGNIAVYSAWFANEARVGDTFPTRNEFGRRDVQDNGEQTGIWNGLHASLQFAAETRRRIEPAGNNVDLARAYFVEGYSLILIGELFCEATVAQDWITPRGKITSAQALDTAIARLQKAREVGLAAGGTEGQALATASLVGIARAHLNAGRRAEASAAAAQVPANFNYNLIRLDDPSNRSLGNTIWSFSESRISLVVGDEYRAMATAGDPRISWTDMGRPAQDGVLRFYRQGKFPGWGSHERFASGLEARYIKVEADRNPAEMLAFINERRAVGQQTALAATTDLNVLMRELMDQYIRDFWLEMKKQAAIRRLGENVVPHVIPPGNTYYKPQVGTVGDQLCWPVPRTEIERNHLWN